MKKNYVLQLTLAAVATAGLVAGSVQAAEVTGASPVLTSGTSSIKPIMLVSSAPCYKALTVTEKKITKSTATLDLHVTYPQIGQATIDKNIRDFIGQTIKNFGPGDKSEHWKSSLWISYKISNYQDKTVSVRFYIYQFTGGAHGSEIPNFRTYSLKTGQRLSYADIFKSDYSYLTALWQNVEPQVTAAYKAKGLTMDKDEMKWIRDGAAPKLDNYRNFYLTNEGLVVYFSQYQAAPYAYGTLEVPVKYSKFGNHFTDYFKNLPAVKTLCGSK